MSFSMDNVVRALAEKARSKPEKLKYSDPARVRDLVAPVHTPQLNEMMSERTQDSKLLTKKEKLADVQSQHDTLLNIRDALYHNRQA